MICHGDLGPWNVVWRGLTPVGLVDFDFAQPGPPMDDIAYALEYLVPFRDDAQALRSHGFRATPDRARRLGLFAEAYGLDGPAGLVDAVIRRQRRTAGDVRTLAERGLEPQGAWVRSGYLDVVAGRVRWSQDNAALFG